MSATPNRIKILPRAGREIRKQSEYYSDKASGVVAVRWRKNVADAIRSLWQFAERYAELETEAPQLQNIRKLHIVGFPKHIIFYRWDSVTKMVLILSVVHGARDFKTLSVE